MIVIIDFIIITFLRYYRRVNYFLQLIDVAKEKILMIRFDCIFCTAIHFSTVVEISQVPRNSSCKKRHRLSDKQQIFSLFFLLSFLKIPLFLF
uniref:Secreted protein n=1 Tax=Heterorhabditis bacteriophora TaxID=37862 RepID=A0A1I7WM75_HETBA